MAKGTKSCSTCGLIAAFKMDFTTLFVHRFDEHPECEYVQPPPCPRCEHYTRFFFTGNFSSQAELARLEAAGRLHIIHHQRPLDDVLRHHEAMHGISREIELFRLIVAADTELFQSFSKYELPSALPRVSSEREEAK